MSVASTTDISFLPRYGTTGRVGINTTTPKAPLDVEGFVGMLSPEAFNRFAYYGLGFGGLSGGDPEAGYGATDGNANVSIYASNNIMSLQFDAFSDARIKNIIGISDAAKDLQTINAIEITDYTFKDKIKNGSKQSKKVIAQQVEKVYPQSVSLHRDFIPNVYQLTNKIEQLENGCLLVFPGNHHISSTAKKLQVVMKEDNSLKEYAIVAIPSPSQVIIKATALPQQQLFVYGEEVNDFRTVDYEGLTTLNISATQELYRLLQQEKELNKTQEKRIAALEETLLQLTNKNSTTTAF